jgi:hypothetical protein
MAVALHFLPRLLVIEFFTWRLSTTSLSAPQKSQNNMG